MANEIFVDTSGYYSLLVRNDDRHKAAGRVLSEAKRRKRRFVTSDYVLDETLTLVKIRTESRVALALLERIEQSSAIVLEDINPFRLQAAKALFRKYWDHEFSFTDCTSFAVMRELKITDALTTDGHFVEAGFRSLLSQK